jgi:hypothetical protein
MHAASVEPVGSSIARSLAATAHLEGIERYRRSTRQQLSFTHWSLEKLAKKVHVFASALQQEFKWPAAGLCHPRWL